jgi:hypothetical protein
MVTQDVYSVNFVEKLKQKLLGLFVYSVLGFVTLALLTQVTFLVLTALDKDEIIQRAVNAFDWKFDGNFKNSPGNIMYDADEHVWVESVTNNVKIGKLAGNRQLEFGVKNVLEEYLQEKGLDLTPTATNKLQVQIVYLDVLTTKKNVSVFHKNEEEVVIRMKGILYKDGKKTKEVMVEESSSEISMSTLIVDEGGKFNQTSLSNALKKASEKLITKIFEGK